MTVKSSSEDQRASRRRRRPLLLFLIVAAIALIWAYPATLGGLSNGFASGHSPLPTAAASGSAASASPVVSPIISTPSSSGLVIGAGLAQVAGVDFTISGDAVADLKLGVATVIRLTLTNPNDVPIYVTALTVAVTTDSRPAGCRTQDNVRITQPGVSSSDPIAVPAGGVVTLASAPRAPQITLLNLPDVNQNPCKGKVFDLAYTGSAHS